MDKKCLIMEWRYAVTHVKYVLMKEKKNLLKQVVDIIFAKNVFIIY